ncbi:hypothetical protein AYJ54_08010 [Bradyrhizobium centrolobii]|uniref:Uncharacterized protein n=1 Tax=Bradyrhizobium centrolobii TaxID=1505087 RepID=A0A176YVW8_9BRAD|nr:hypothetical protein AYJ54_08010 [Bradyrhizobium centrolobii]
MSLSSHLAASNQGAPLSDRASLQSRFVIRMGGIGWMVYDRERKGPALIGTDYAARLTREQAERVMLILTGPAEDEVSF